MHVTGQSPESSAKDLRFWECKDVGMLYLSKNLELYC